MLWTFKDQAGSVALSPHPSAFQLTWFREISYIDKGGEFFFICPNRSVIRSGGFCSNGFFFDGLGGSFANETRDFIIQSRDYFHKPFYPNCGPLAFRKPHFSGILVAKQAPCKDAVKPFNDRLITGELRAPMWNVWFCFSISLVAVPMNSRPGSTWSHCGHFKGTH